MKQASDKLAQRFNECQTPTGHHETTLYTGQPLKFFVAASYIPLNHEKSSIAHVQTDPGTRCIVASAELFATMENHVTCIKKKNETSSVLLTYSDHHTSEALVSYGLPMPQKPPELLKTAVFWGQCGNIPTPLIQIRDRLIWARDECKGVPGHVWFGYEFAGYLHEDGTYTGEELRTTYQPNEPPCTMRRLYTITVLAKNMLFADVVQAPAAQQPAASIRGTKVCDLELTWPQKAMIGLQ